MRSLRKCLTAVLMVAGLVAAVLAGPAHALMMRVDVDSTFVVVDDVNDTQWADLNRFADLDYSGVIAEIGAMNSAVYAGAADWHLASASEVGSLFTEVVTIGDARQFDDTLVNPSVGLKYNGRYDLVNVTGAHAGATWSHLTTEPDDSTAFYDRHTDILNYMDGTQYPNVGAWVLSSATASASAPVPEPATLLLLGVGLVGCARAARKNNTGR